jgi:hypothetical protein
VIKLPSPRTGPERHHVGVQIKPLERLAARREAESERVGTKVGTKLGSEGEGVSEVAIWLEPGAGVEPATY